MTMSDESANVGSAPEQASTVADQIAAHLAELDTVAQKPLTEHADAYQRVHVELQRALAEIDSV
ncbi:MAG: hypothetical protein ABI232_08005 [Jatrophihabitantaceae bacterium]